MKLVMKRMITYILLSLLLPIMSCTFSNEEILKSRRWKYESGYNICDIINFNDSDFAIIEDSIILFNGKKEAIIQNVSKSKMTIKSSSGLYGKYVYFDKRIKQ